MQSNRSPQDREPQPASSSPPEGAAPGLIVRAAAHGKRLRAWVHRRPGGAKVWRGGVAVTGLVVILVGIIFLAVPGPGWITIFAGLGIWATEFARAASLLKYARRKVTAWTAWLKRQPRWAAVTAGASGLVLFAVAGVVVWALAH